jgi:hypothetical protein
MFGRGGDAQPGQRRLPRPDEEDGRTRQLCEGSSLQREQIFLSGSTCLTPQRRPPSSQGSVVDNAALIRALDEEQILGAALDVIAGEPLIPADHPLVRHSRCIVLPHVGSATTETREEMAMICADNVARGCRGEPLRIELK